MGGGEENQFRTELGQSEREWLHEQIRSLQQQLDDRTQELQTTERQLELINREIQNILQTMPLSLAEAKDFARMLLADWSLPPGMSQTEAYEVFAALLSFVYQQTVLPEDLRQGNQSFQSDRGDRLDPKNILDLPLRNKLLDSERGRASQHKLREQRRALKIHLTLLMAQMDKMSKSLQISQGFVFKQVEKSDKQP